MTTAASPNEMTAARTAKEVSLKPWQLNTQEDNDTIPTVDDASLSDASASTGTANPGLHDSAVRHQEKMSGWKKKILELKADLESETLRTARMRALAKDRSQRSVRSLMVKKNLRVGGGVLGTIPNRYDIDAPRRRSMDDIATSSNREPLRRTMSVTGSIDENETLSEEEHEFGVEELQREKERISRLDTNSDRRSSLASLPDENENEGALCYERSPLCAETECINSSSNISGSGKSVTEKKDQRQYRKKEAEDEVDRVALAKVALEAFVDFTRHDEALNRGCDESDDKRREIDASIKAYLQNTIQNLSRRDGMDFVPKELLEGNIDIDDEEDVELPSLVSPSVLEDDSAKNEDVETKLIDEKPTSAESALAMQSFMESMISKYEEEESSQEPSQSMIGYEGKPIGRARTKTVCFATTETTKPVSSIFDVFDWGDGSKT